MRYRGSYVLPALLAVLVPALARGAPEQPQAAAPPAGTPPPLIANTFWPLRTDLREPVTLAPERVQLFGPFIEQDLTPPETWGTVRPLWIDFHNEPGPVGSFHLAYPFFNHRESPGRTRWDVLRLMRYHRYERTRTGHPETFFNLFPLIWHKDTGEPETSYQGLFPLAGKVRGFLFYDQFNWAAFPIYFAWHRQGAVRHFMPFPFVQWQSGEGASGAALWPLIGHFRQEGNYDLQYLLWPLIYRKIDQYDRGPHPRLRQGVLPFYALERSPNVTDWTFVWPFFGWRREHEPAYQENRYFWPFLVQGRGKKYVNRWMPFYTHEIVDGVDEQWYLWPLLHAREWTEGEVRVNQEEFLFFLIWSQRQSSLTNPDAPAANLTHVWPLASYWDNGAGRTQFQLLSPLEVFFPQNRVIRRKYTPLFALYRYDARGNGAVVRQSLLWNLLASERREGYRKTQLGALFKHVESDERGCIEFLEGLVRIGHRGGEPEIELFWNNLDAVSFPPATARQRRGPKR